MLRAYQNLRRKGVIGINERNVALVHANNPRRLLHLVNDKLETKRIANAAKIPSPELYGVVRNAWDMRRLESMIDKPDGFVVKPSQGSQGKGIMVIDQPLKNGWRLASGKRVTLSALKFHINNILSGMYSLGGQPDKALIEYRVKFDDVFAKISFRGVPDIRVIVLKGIPVFGMLRLPTSDSDGKANLHRGGIGVGIDMATGVTMSAMQYDNPIDAHPDTAHPVSGVETPYWDEILTMAARSYDVSGLGYLGVDIVLDAELGPLLLEMNARPGMSIQIANRVGLRGVIDQAKAIDATTMTADERVAAAKTLSSRQ